MTKKSSNILVNLLAAGRQCRDKSGLITYTWIGKNCAMVACRRDYFAAKEPGLESADSATNVYSLNRRAVSCKAGHLDAEKKTTNHRMFCGYYF
jgi:hypothetical protein